MMEAFEKLYKIQLPGAADTARYMTDYDRCKRFYQSGLLHAAEMIDDDESDCKDCDQSSGCRSCLSIAIRKEAEK